MHIHIYIHTYIHFFVYIYPMILNCTYLFTLIYMYVYIYIYTYIRMYECRYVYMVYMIINTTPPPNTCRFCSLTGLTRAFVNLEALRSKESIDSGNAISYFKCELLRSRVNCSFSRNTTMWKGVTGTIVFFEKGNGILLKATPNIFKEIVPIDRDRQKKKGRPFAGYFVHTCRYSIGFWQVPAPVCNVKHVLPQNTRCSPRSARPTALSCAFSGMVLGLDVLRGQYRSKWTKKIPQIPLQSKFRTSLHAEASRRECRNWKFSCRKCVRLSSAEERSFSASLSDTCQKWLHLPGAVSDAVRGPRGMCQAKIIQANIKRNQTQVE